VSKEKRMVDHSATGEAARDYAEAYTAHSSRSDLAGAPHLYRRLTCLEEATSGDVAPTLIAPSPTESAQ
jgi:hypothetical protein